MIPTVILQKPMNSRASDLVNSFFDSVILYIDLEYDLSDEQKSHCGTLVHVVATYYFGGNTVCETARYIVDFIRSIKHE